MSDPDKSSNSGASDHDKPTSKLESRKDDV